MIRTRQQRERMRERLAGHALQWHVELQETVETETSLLGFGVRQDRHVVLKVLEEDGDEWACGEVLRAFDGRGVVPVYEHTGGAVLMERLRPGRPLAEWVRDGRDEEATAILARIIRSMRTEPSAQGFRTVEEWARGFARYAESGDTRIPRELVEEAEQMYLRLCRSQRRPRLLHGDLHHYNVLFDRRSGWLAIDPKGVVGEVEYEIGAALRNPVEDPDLFCSADVVARRVRRFADILDLDTTRVLGWAFAQAVLSAIWAVEDGLAIEGPSPQVRLAAVISPMLETH